MNAVVPGRCSQTTRAKLDVRSEPLVLLAALALSRVIVKELRFKKAL